MRTGLLRRSGSVLATFCLLGLGAPSAHSQELQTLRMRITNIGTCDTTVLEAEHGQPTTLNIATDNIYYPVMFYAPTLNIQQSVNTTGVWTVTDIYLGDDLPAGDIPFTITGTWLTGSGTDTLCNGVIQSH
ncbi:hypothetical protein [Nocardia crassostreae]|uniref:hypothetical protein n=1 Tax=Nocardia crassostreae TaxID=53428 RepID=UPI0008301687|nr:hypothetical protein [Nocardia crassostreae]